MKEECNAVVLRTTVPLAQGLTSLSRHQGKVVAVPGDVGLGEAVLGLARRHLRRFHQGTELIAAEVGTQQPCRATTSQT